MTVGNREKLSQVLDVLYLTEVFSFFCSSGNLGACHIRLENPAHPVKYRGVVCSMKESFGFIERADVVKEIFFHFSETKSKEELQLGDDVEFIILTRNVSTVLEFTDTWTGLY